MRCLIASQKTNGAFYCTREVGHDGPCAAREQTMSLHKKISFVKSVIRIFGYFGLMLAFGLNVTGYLAGGVLIVSEIVGIVEELGEK